MANKTYEELLFNSIKNGQQSVKSVYDIWLELGNTGTPQDFIDSLRGKSAYEYARDGGYTGTEAEFAAKMASQYATYSLNKETSTLTIDLHE